MLRSDNVLSELSQGRCGPEESDQVRSTGSEKQGLRRECELSFRPNGRTRSDRKVTVGTPQPSFGFSTPPIVDRVFLPPLESSKRCPYTLHDGRIIGILLPNISRAIAIRVDTIAFSFTENMAQVFDELLRLATTTRTVQSNRRTSTSNGHMS